MLIAWLAPVLMAGLMLTGADTEKGFIGVKLKGHEDGSGPVVVDEVIEKSPAEAAGLKKDDVVVKIKASVVVRFSGNTYQAKFVEPGVDVLYTEAQKRSNGSRIDCVGECKHCTITFLICGRNVILKQMYLSGAGKYMSSAAPAPM